MQPFVEALEAFSRVRFPDAVRAQWLDNDAQAIASAWEAALAEGAISENLRAWRVQCLIYAAAGDADFYEQARRAAGEISTAEFVSIEERDHLGGHLQPDPVLPAVLRTLRGSGG